jgi:hypothetical protein
VLQLVALPLGRSHRCQVVVGQETVRIWGRSSTEWARYAASSTGPLWWVKSGYHRWK